MCTSAQFSTSPKTPLLSWLFQPVKPAFLYAFFLHSKLCWTVLQTFLSVDRLPRPRVTRAQSSPRYFLKQSACRAVLCLTLFTLPDACQGVKVFLGIVWTLLFLLPIYAPSHTPTPPTSFEFEYYSQRAKLPSFFPTETFRINFVIK